MQIVLSGDNLHETSKPIFFSEKKKKKKKNIVNLSTAELTQRVVKVKQTSKTQVRLPKTFCSIITKKSYCILNVSYQRNVSFPKAYLLL